MLRHWPVATLGLAIDITKRSRLGLPIRGRFPFTCSFPMAIFPRPHTACEPTALAAVFGVSDSTLRVNNKGRTSRGDGIAVG